MTVETGVIDKNGVPICLGDKLRTFDRTGKEWVGHVVRVDPNMVMHKAPQYALRTNYDTWLHPEHGKDYEVLPKDEL